MDKALVSFYKEVVVYIYTTSGIMISLLSIATELNIKPLYHFHHVMFDDMIVYFLEKINIFFIYVDMIIYIVSNDNIQCTVGYRKRNKNRK